MDKEDEGYLQEFALRFLQAQCPGALRMALSPYPPSSTPGELPTSSQAWEERLDPTLGYAAKLQICP